MNFNFKDRCEMQVIEGVNCTSHIKMHNVNTFENIQISRNIITGYTISEEYSLLANCYTYINLCIRTLFDQFSICILISLCRRR